jgi:hypothetical protein
MRTLAVGREGASLLGQPDPQSGPGLGCAPGEGLMQMAPRNGQGQAEAGERTSTHLDCVVRGFRELQR